MPFSDLAQIAGACLVLAAFVVTQNGLGRPDSTYVLTLNAVGAGVLAYLALIGAQWGFLALEGIWSLLATYSLTRKFLRVSRDGVSRVFRDEHRRGTRD